MSNGFRVLVDEKDYEIEIKVRWGAGGIPDLDELQDRLTRAYAQAFAEVTERLETVK